jgi:hypothetical protein
MSDAAVTVCGQKKHLVFKRIRTERPAVAENNRLAGAPILEVDLCSVFGSNDIHGHFFFLVLV